MTLELRIGVIGYSAQRFDEAVALELLTELLDAVVQDHPNHRFALVSGLTDLGIPALAYREATRRGWRTVGVACAQAREYGCYPVDESVIVGEVWGDESETFLAGIDVLVRVGGGPQSAREYDHFSGPKHMAELIAD